MNVRAMKLRKGLSCDPPAERSGSGYTTGRRLIACEISSRLDLSKSQVGSRGDGTDWESSDVRVGFSRFISRMRSFMPVVLKEQSETS